MRVLLSATTASFIAALISGCGKHGKPLKGLEMEFNIISFRRCGEPKLKKPKELKGVDRAFSVDYIPKKVRCQVFILGDDVFVKHVDYFSPSLYDPEMVGAPLDAKMSKHLGRNRPAKFVYGDCWGDIVLKQEAWIKISGLVSVSRNDKFYPRIVLDILKMQAETHSMDYLDLVCSDMERFWEGVVMGVQQLERGATE